MMNVKWQPAEVVIDKCSLHRATFPESLMQTLIFQRSAEINTKKTNQPMEELPRHHRYRKLAKTIKFYLEPSHDHHHHHHWRQSHRFCKDSTVALLKCTLTESTERKIKAKANQSESSTSTMASGRVMNERVRRTDV